jgi:hypothetical protein
MARAPKVEEEMNALQRLKQLKAGKSPVNALSGVTKPTKASSVSFVSSPPGHLRVISEASPEAILLLRVLIELHGEHQQRCPNGIARVALSDWRARAGMDRIRFFNLMRKLEMSGKIIREHGHARPKPEE